MGLVLPAMGSVDDAYVVFRVPGDMRFLNVVLSAIARPFRNRKINFICKVSSENLCLIVAVQHVYLIDSYVLIRCGCNNYAITLFAGTLLGRGHPVDRIRGILK